jgi:hypothetical protein
MYGTFRRVAASVVVAALLALVGTDLWIGGVRSWWDHHSLTASIASNLAVLAIAAVVVDDVVARRKRRERSASVGIQGLVLYGQVQRAHSAVVADQRRTFSLSDLPEPLWNLATMLPMASPSVLDDPYARSYLQRVERITGLLFNTALTSRDADLSVGVRTELSSEMAGLRESVDLILDRLSAADRNIYEGMIG